MTLKDLVEIYDGNIKINVYKAIEGGVEDVVSFEVKDADAIKDEVINAELKEFSVKVSNNKWADAYIEVVI